MARILWALRNGTDNWEYYHEPSSERQIENRALVSLWEAHMKSPAAALQKALRHTEDGAGRAQSAAVGGSET